jgi:peptidoglycan/xylan/chitin deacetylase (PgdA/CDA1 family)
MAVSAFRAASVPDEVSQVHPLLKRRIERAVSSSAVGWMTRRRVRGKRLILAYHGIIPEGESPAGERALFVRQRDFATQLDMLAKIADVAPLGQLDDDGDGRPRIAITFDDAYRGAVNEGVQELVKRSLPATIFVAPGRLNGHLFWWDVLSDATESLDDGVRNYALHNLGGADERVREWAAGAAIPVSEELPLYMRTATRAELAAALALPGITAGSHTWSHANLASLDAADVAAEVRRTRTWLRAEFGDKAIDWLAYPYGLDSAEAQRAVAGASYSGALRIEGGWHRARDVNPLARPRLNVSAGLSVAGLRARLVGAMSS